MIVCVLPFGPAGAAPDGDRTLVILPFENNSVTTPETYDPLKSGLSVMLMTELANSEAAFTLVEREKIRALLDEITLGQTGVIDASTAVKMGKMLGAHHRFRCFYGDGEKRPYRVTTQVAPPWSHH